MEFGLNYSQPELCVNGCRVLICCGDPSALFMCSPEILHHLFIGFIKS